MLKKFTYLLCVGAMLAGISAEAQQRTPPTRTEAPAPGDSTRSRGATPPRPTSGPKPYKDVITDKAVSKKGMFTVHEVGDKYYFEIPNNLLGRDLLFVTRISKAPSGPRTVYSGDDVNDNVYRFERGPKDKIFLRELSHLEIGSDSTEGMYKNVMNNNIQPIAQAFDIQAYSKDSASSVIDVTSLINGDNEIFFFSSRAKRSLNLSAIMADRSYVESLKSFPQNVEIKTVKTYMRSSGGAGGAASPLASMMGGSGGPATMEINTSLVLLPEVPMKPRLFDDRIGYFTTQTVTDFDQNPQGVESFRYIARYRLEPKPQDVEKYKRGELVEPAKQIVYYVDATTPKKWIPYLMQGVTDWQIAFEKAGFKNAIVGKLAPTPQEDSTFSLEDARHSAIVYKPSSIANASGPHIHDPRSGEIIESHVNWYHNVMSLLRNWYLIQTAAVDPGARKMEFDTELMGQLIRFVSSHEIGHTLGLRHNFGSSSSVPVEKLRDKAWVEANGHTPSIMDYARFNYVAQPEDNISRVGLFPRIGDYDIWAIEWGYKWLPDAKTAEQEVAVLNKLTSEKLKNKRLWWGDGEGNRGDPRSQTEDLGDNAMLASDYGIKNLKRIVTQIPEWSKTPNKAYEGLAELYSNVVGQFGRYIGHVSSNIGGVERTPKRVEQSGPVFEFTPKATQKNAMEWLNNNVFKTPTWLIQKNISDVTSANPISMIGNLQGRALGVLSSGTITNLILNEASEGAKAYTATEFLNSLRGYIFSELATKAPIDVYRRQLQKQYVERLTSLVKTSAPQSVTIPGLGSMSVNSGPSPTSDVISLAKAQLRLLAGQLRAASVGYTNAMSKDHLLDLQERIKLALEPK